jgi:hypothetical protein
MVSLPGKLTVKEVLKSLELNASFVELGKIEFIENINPLRQEELKKRLKKYGLELLDDKRSILIEKIKNLIVEMIHYTDKLPKEDPSESSVQN